MGIVQRASSSQTAPEPETKWEHATGRTPYRRRRSPQCDEHSTSWRIGRSREPDTNREATELLVLRDIEVVAQVSCRRLAVIGEPQGPRLMGLLMR
jgi:hypothetical protein